MELVFYETHMLYFSDEQVPSHKYLYYTNLTQGLKLFLR
jgi:hypothetical protein